MAWSYEVKCENCGFTSRMKNGPAHEGTFYLSVGCMKCKDITILDTAHLSQKDHEMVRRGVCIKCGGKLVNYRKEEPSITGGFLCPSCGKRALKHAKEGLRGIW